MGVANDLSVFFYVHYEGRTISFRNALDVSRRLHFALRCWILSAMSAFWERFKKNVVSDLVIVAFLKIMNTNHVRDLPELSMRNNFQALNE